MSINGNSELIVRYDGSKASFESTNGPKNTYIEAKVSKVVFITGSTATNATAEQKCQYIWITDGSSDKYINMSNVADIQKSLTHIAGFAIDGSQATIGAGQNGLNFVGTNGIKITLNPTTAVDKNGVPYWSIEIDGDDIKAIVESADAKASSATAKIATILGVDGTSNKSIRMIASEEAGKVETALKGNSSTDSKDSATIAGAKKYTDAAIDDLLDGETIGGLRDDIDDLKDNKADLENGKIPTTQLPDYILGQLLFGGTVSSGTSTTMVVTPSGNYKLKHTVPASQTTVTINKDTFATHEGEYFIATAGFTAVGVPVNTGDWIVSTGTDWKKIDNTDAITKVAGVVPTNGDVSKDGLITALGVDKKYEKPSIGIPKSDLEEEVQTSLDKIDSIDNKVEQTEYNDKVAELETSIGGKYTKPAEGIPEKDLAFKVATETEVVNAISKAAADLNDKIDNKISKTDTLPAENVGSLSYGAKGLASTNPIIANRIPYLKADAFAFLQPEDFTVEVKYNDEVNWLTLDNNNADMRGMFAQLSFGTGFPIDGSNTNWQDGSKIRITLAPKADRNAKVDFVALNVYANGRTFDILTEYYDSSPSKEGWYSVGDPLIVNSNGIAFVKYNQYFSFAGYARGGARFTFTITGNTQYGSKIVGISGFGNLAAEISPTSINAPYTLGTLWYWDYLKNVYFPNDIYEGGTPLKNKYASISKIPSALPNPESLTYKVNGVTSTYNGSSAATIQIFTPTTIGSQGQLLQSMGGGAPQWTNLSSIKEAIGFAKDLTGVLEATPEEFTFRPSAGNKSIRDEGAVIRRIKGNTTVWGQYVKNGDFAEGTRYFTDLNSTLSDNGDGSITVTNKLDNSCGLITVFSTHIPRGHRILAIVDYQRDSSSSSSTFFYLQRNGGGFDSHITSGIADAQRRVDYAIITSTDDITGFYFYPFFQGPVGTQSIIYTMAVYDLTAIFDAGNEPTTLEAFREVYPDGYYPYCEPTIRNVKTTAIETVGFNLFNGLFAELIGGKTYYVGGSNIGTLRFYPNGSSLSEEVVLDANNTFTPLVSGKLRSNGSDVCVHFQHSGIKDGECADYVKHTLGLPEIAKYFPDGMNGIGKVYDEINTENAIQRWKSRPWQSGDDDNDDVITDGTTTIYKLSAPIVTPILEPIQLVYDVEDFGTERAISPEDSAPFRADIVYQFNAEGRIRDNGRNIEKLENKIRSYHDDGVMVTIDREIITTKSIIGNSEFRYALPDAPQDVKDDTDGTLATEFWVQKNIPTEIATATQLKKVDSLESIAIAPNIMYEYTSGIGETGRVIFPARLIPPGSYDYTWMLRFPSIASSECLIFRDSDIRWKDGIPPTFSVGCALEIYIKEDATTVLGEWKIYR